MYRIIPAAQIGGNAAVTPLSQVQAMIMSVSSIKPGTASAKAEGKAVQRSCGNTKALAELKPELKPDFSEELSSYLDL